MAVGFSQSKHTIKRGTTTLTSNLDANQITFPHPTKFSTMHNALKCGSNMMPPCYEHALHKKTSKIPKMV
jgi:hypothetical protein